MSRSIRKPKRFGNTRKRWAKIKLIYTRAERHEMNEKIRKMKIDPVEVRDVVKEDVNLYDPRDY